MRIHQIFLEILSGNHISYAILLNDICDLGNEVKVTRFELGCGLPWCSCVIYLVRICQIFLEVLSLNHLSYGVTLNDLCDLENEIKVTWFELGLHRALVLICPNIFEETSNISSDIAQNHPPYLVHLNDFCDPENEVKVTQFELGLCLAPVLLCTIFGEDESNIS